MTPNGSIARIKVAAGALGILMSGVLAPSTSEARGETGPNDGGVLIVHTSSTEFTTDEDYCGMSGLGDCEDAVTQAEPGTEVVAHILAAFPATPRLRGVTFGFDYPVNTSVLTYGSCADFEVSDGGWPAAGNGTALTWLNTQTDEIVEVYWCGLYVDGVDPAVFELIPSPTQGGFFADDSIPAVLDPIAEYGALGFSTNGTLPCPEPLFACCFADGSCSVLTVGECESAGGTPEESDSSCEPNPCPQPEGACCFGDGSCGVFTAESCDERRGVYQGDDTSCDPNPCPQLEGACCFDDGSCGSLTEESCDVDGGAYQGDGTSCNPNPCPQPEGACCFDDGGCAVRTPTSCANQGGIYQGNDASCDPNPCPLPEGACCLDEGGCAVLTASDCGAVGEYEGSGTPCTPDPCTTPYGACCYPSGTCELRTESGCLDDGTFLGPDTSCSPNPCSQPEPGACCIVFDCVFVTEFACLDLGGTFVGESESCDPNPCAEQESGACCLDDGACLVITATDCAANAGDYQGDGSGCVPSPCPTPVYGACCLAQGLCEVNSDIECANSGGAFQGDGASCDPNPCPQPCVAFALNGRANSELPVPPSNPFAGRFGTTTGDGPNRGGTLVLHSSGVIYTDDDADLYCGSSVVGDCNAVNARSDSEEAVVAHVIALFSSVSEPRLSGVTFGVDYPACVSVTDWRACSNFELTTGDWPGPGSGTAVTWAQAETGLAIPVYWFAAYGYAVEPGELSLTPHPTQGAFFADDTVPATLDPIHELGSLGFYRSGVIPCPQSPEPVGACCLGVECQILTFDSCDELGGDFVSVNLTCDPNPCDTTPPSGACCLPEGHCETRNAATCDALGGEYLGDQTECTPELCMTDTGACCFPTECAVLRRSDCEDAGGLFRDNDKSCDPSPCPPIGACCFSDGTCVSTFRSLCEANDGDYLGNEILCDGGLCPRDGACCFTDGSCSLLIEQNCTDQDGTYQGESTTCVPNPCHQPEGACCLGDGSCVVLTNLQCDDQGGSFLGEDVPCETQECADLSGACCFVDRTCLFVTQAECAAVPGYFLGQAVPCDPNPCPGERGCSDPRPMNERGRPEVVRRPGSGPSSFAETGRGQGVVATTEFRGGCGGAVHFHADGTYENGYTWQYGGVAPPLYGAFAELYPIGVAKPCAIVLDLSQVGGASGQTADLYVWQSTNGLPGAVIGFRPDVDPGPVAFWPSLSRHALEIDSNCSFGDEFFVGYWANWPSAVAGWYVGADTDGFGGGCSLTKIAPGQGFPTGWQDVSVAWGPTESLGIGVEVYDCDIIPVRESSWGKIKSLFR